MKKTHTMACEDSLIGNNHKITCVKTYKES